MKNANPRFANITTRLLVNQFFVLLLALCAGCASPGTKHMDYVFLQTMRDTGKITITDYQDQHYGSHGANMAVLGGVVGGVVAGIANSSQSKKPYVEQLNEKCIVAIEQVLLHQKDFSYVERSSIGLTEPKFTKVKDAPSNYMELKDKYGITGVIKVTLKFQISPGWKKPMQLLVIWDMCSPEGESKVNIVTDAASEKGVEVFPDTRNPVYEATFVELASRNATKFIEMLRQGNGGSPRQ
ncbi:MAG: hypothetical protein NT088_05225 [Candidatus Omnitrophica bacterium]|nr:hypothetical protein [Candidatus Omnitrophota bacterium]